MALGLDGVRGIVADSKAYCKRTLGVCLEQRVGLITLVPRPCAVRQEVEAWGQQHGVLPLLLEKPGRTRREPPRCWHGQSVVRRVPVEDADGRLDVAEIRFLVVHSSQLAQQAAICRRPSQRGRACRRAHPARGSPLVCLCGRRRGGHQRLGRPGQGRRGRTPRLWRSHVLHYHVEAVRTPKKRTRRGRPPKAEAPRWRSAIASGCTQRPCSLADAQRQRGKIHGRVPHPLERGVQGSCGFTPLPVVRYWHRLAQRRDAGLSRNGSRTSLNTDHQHRAARGVEKL